jgi:hypothetical protein
MSIKTLLNGEGVITTSKIDYDLINTITLSQSRIEILENNTGSITSENISQIQEDILTIKSMLEDIKEKVYALYLSNFNPNLE